MTIYFDEYFSGGTTQQIGSCERIVFNSDSNLDMLQTSSVTSPSTWETVLSAKLAKNARIRIDGFKKRDGTSFTPPPSGATAEEMQKAFALIGALVHMMGGAVVMSELEFLEGGKRRINSSMVEDMIFIRLENQ